MSRNRRRAIVEAKDVPVIDTFQFAARSPCRQPSASAIEWDATGPPQLLGSGHAVPPTDPAAFLGMFAPARSTGHFSGAELGFSFASRRAASTDRGYAEIGTERNGVFLS